MNVSAVSTTMTKFFPIILLSFSVLTGCGQIGSTPADHDGNLVGELTTSPNPPREKQPTQFTLQLKDGSGQPVSNAKMELHLEMKEMDHGRNVVDMKPTDQAGLYTGSGTFPMDQTWEIYARIQSPKENATLKFQVQVQR